MTDREFIYSYLDKNFEPIIDGYGLIFRDLRFLETYNVDNFKVNYQKIIGDWNTDEKLTTYDIVVEWYKEKEENLIRDLLDYLNNSTFELGIDDWVVKNSDGDIITLKHVIAEFDGKYSKEFITHFYGEWYSEKVCEASEKIMNQW